MELGAVLALSYEKWVGHRHHANRQEVALLRYRLCLPNLEYRAVKRIKARVMEGPHMCATLGRPHTAAYICGVM